MDVLAEVLQEIRLHTSTYFCSQFSAPWGMDIAKTDKGIFHIVIKGQCWMKLVDSDELLHLEEGDIVAFPTGGAHWIGDCQSSPVLPSENVVAEMELGRNPFACPNQSDSVNTLMCGEFSYDSSVKHPLIRDLPCFIHIKVGQSSDHIWLKSLTNVLSKESQYPGPGSSVIVDRLTEVLFMQLLRTHMTQHSNTIQYISALSDPKIGMALNLIHSDTHAHWNVSRLGEKVAMSRTAFTEKFSQLIGQPPKQYISNWRFQKAKSMLLTTPAPLHVIAEKSGFSSEAAFSKAFKQHFSLPPGQVRKSKNQLAKGHDL